MAFPLDLKLLDMEATCPPDCQLYCCIDEALLYTDRIEVAFVEAWNSKD
mgnify:CR=1 FL=1